MSEKRFQVVLNGRLADGMAAEQVKANVAALFKVGLDKVEKLFGDQPVVIKKGLDEATAKKYQLALQRAGALCQVVDTAVMASSSPPAPEQAHAAPGPEAPPATALTDAERAADDDTIPSIDSGLHKSVVKPAPQGPGSMAGVVIDEPGVKLVEAESVPEPQLDLTGLSMDEPGVILVEPEETEEPEVDLSGLSMDEPGVVLVEPEVVEAPEVDVSNLSLDEPGVTLIEHEEPEKPEIDTSKLSLD